MKISKLLPFALAALMFTSACSDSDSDNDPAPADEVEVPAEVAASASAITTFHKSEAYYQMFVYRYDDSTSKWTARLGSHFSTVTEAEPTYLGFTNPYVENSGVNLFGMPTLYQSVLGTNNIKEAGINADKVLQFFPSAAGSKSGTVKVIAQDIVMKRKDGNPATITIGISGEGTYDEETKVIDFIVKFNETSIGGKADVSRKYKMSVSALTLN